MLLKRLARFGKLPGRQQLLFLEALFLHLSAGLLLKIIPFRWISVIFSNRQTKVYRQQPEVIELLKTAIQRAGRVSPWRNRCLVSSLAGRCMLRRRKIESQLSLGIAKGKNGRLVAHAWLRSGDCELVEKYGDYTLLYAF